MPGRIHYPLSFQGQCITLVLAALKEMGGVRTKQEAIAYLDRQRWFNLLPSDLVIYPSHRNTNKEPRWHTQIAFGRQWAVEKDLLTHYEGIDQWEIAPDSARRLESVHDRFRRNAYDVRRGYLWSPEFKLWLCPDYQPSEEDAKRPADDVERYV